MLIRIAAIVVPSIWVLFYLIDQVTCLAAVR